VVILNSRRGPTLLCNDALPAHWLQARLVGTKSNYDGIGARVKVVAGDLTLADEVRSGRGYQSDYGRRLHFGLGGHERIDLVEVQWPTGLKTVLKAPAIDRLLTLKEGAGE